MMAVTTRKIKKWAEKGKVEKLIKALQTTDKFLQFVRRDAAEALGDIGDAKAAEPLVRALSSHDYSLQEKALKALIKIGSPAVGALIKGLNTNVRLKSAEALSKIGDSKAVIPLIKALGDSDKMVRNWSVNALVNIGSPAVTPLIDALNNDDENIRKHAAEALCRINDPKSLDSMIKVLKDNNDEVRKYAAIALSKMGDNRAVDSLVKALKDKNEAVRRVAAGALGNIGNAKAVDPLIKALEDENEHIIENASEALVKIGTPAVDSLIKALSSKNTSIRFNAVKILDQLKWRRRKNVHQDTIESLSKILEEKQKSIRKKAAGILDKLGWQPTRDEAGAKYYIAKGSIEKCIEIGTAAVDPLINAMENDVKLRKDAVKTLGKIGDAKAAESLIRIMGDNNSGVCDDSSAALVQIGTPAVDPLINALNDEDKYVRRRVVIALAQIASPRAVDPLVKMLGDDDRVVIKRAFAALKKLYQLKSLSQEKKKAILKLKGNKIADHQDHTDDYYYRELGCDLPMVHTDNPEIYFDL